MRKNICALIIAFAAIALSTKGFADDRRYYDLNIGIASGLRTYHEDGLSLGLLYSAFARSHGEYVYEPENYGTLILIAGKDMSWKNFFIVYGGLLPIWGIHGSGNNALIFPLPYIEYGFRMNVGQSHFIFGFHLISPYVGWGVGF